MRVLFDGDIQWSGTVEEALLLFDKHYDAKSLCLVKKLTTSFATLLSFSPSPSLLLTTV